MSSRGNNKSKSTANGSGSIQDKVAKGLAKPTKGFTKKSNLLDDVIGPMFFMTCFPIFALWFYRVCDEYDGSITLAAKAYWDNPNLWNKTYVMPNEQSLKILGSFVLLQLTLLVFLPGRKWLAVVTPAGLRPAYKLNGPLSYIITLAVLYFGGHHFNLFSLAAVYDNFKEILTFLNFFSFLGCFFFYYKGLHFPSSADAGTTGHAIRDFFWGTELHPSFMGYYAKQLVNCRLSMTGWICILWCCAAKQYQLYGYVSNSMVVSVALQTLYIMKFFIWEHGYFNSIDIMHDRFGFYIYWGVSVWVPSFYTLVGLYLVKHPYQLSTEYAVFCFVAGITCLYLNYATDEQRLRFRETSGNTDIWGAKPKYIRAKYTTSDGVERESLLLTNGYWGLSRHFNYVPEIGVSLFWSLPALFNHAVPYFYVIFLTCLLTHRLHRDEERCSQKYGTYYQEYKKKVPYFLIPYVY